MRLMMLAVLALTACGISQTGPVGQPSSTDVNSETGARGGTSSSGSHQ